jgi:AraC-like DNA-binding protein
MLATRSAEHGNTMWQITSVLVAFGILLSLFFSSLILAKPCRGGAQWYLAGFILSSGLSITYQVLFPTGLYCILPHLVKTYIPPQFLIGPLLFLYVSAITDPDFHFSRRMLLHFLPFFLSLAYLAPFFAQTAAAKITFVQTTVSSAVPSRGEEWVFWLSLQASLCVYLFLSLRQYRQYRLRIQEMASNIARYAWNWLLNFLLCICLLLLSFLVVDFFMLRGVPLVAFNPFISIALSVNIFFLGWHGLLRLDYILPRAETEPQPVLAAAPEENVEELKAFFDQILERTRRDALFRTPDLTLPELANTLGYSRTELSRIVNIGGTMSFYDFINKLRVEDVQRALDTAKGKSSGILQLAFDSGFSTSSTFYSAFKKWTGTTPSLYRKMN